MNSSSLSLFTAGINHSVASHHQPSSLFVATFGSLVSYAPSFALSSHLIFSHSGSQVSRPQHLRVRAVALRSSGITFFSCLPSFFSSCILSWFSLRQAFTAIPIRLSHSSRSDIGSTISRASNDNTGNKSQESGCEWVGSEKKRQAEIGDNNIIHWRKRRFSEQSPFIRGKWGDRTKKDVGRPKTERQIFPQADSSSFSLAPTDKPVMTMSQCLSPPFTFRLFVYVSRNHLSSLPCIFQSLFLPEYSVFDLSYVCVCPETGD